MSKEDWKKGEQIAEGKTKKIFAARGSSNFVIIENKPDVTAFDDPSFTKKFGLKAVYATTTACRVFALLRSAGLQVAFQEQLSPTEFVAPRCSMIPLEAVARRLAVGSYLARHPELATNPPWRFHRLKVELFLKTTRGQLLDSSGKPLVDGLDPQKGEEDPLILNPDKAEWLLCHSKKSSFSPEANLGKAIDPCRIFGDRLWEVTWPKVLSIKTTLRKVFLVLEAAWKTIGYRLVDLKIEFGFTPQGELVVADVIDNDSWRLNTADWNELSKQIFRDGAPLDEVERKYGFVAGLVEQFRIPLQALVLWRASDKDEFPVQDSMPGVAIEKVTLSGHKSPQLCIDRLEGILRKYPEGGVVVARVGMSNGLGPLLAARTIWPVISVPGAIKEFPEDVWSSLRTPSHVPMATIASEANAIEFALNILALKNPALAMYRQFEIEELDTLDTNEDRIER